MSAALDARILGQDACLSHARLPGQSGSSQPACTHKHHNHQIHLLDSPHGIIKSSPKAEPNYETHENVANVEEPEPEPQPKTAEGEGVWTLIAFVLLALIILLVSLSPNLLTAPEPPPPVVVTETVTVTVMPPFEEIVPHVLASPGLRQLVQDYVTNFTNIELTQEQINKLTEGLSVVDASAIQVDDEQFREWYAAMAQAKMDEKLEQLGARVGAVSSELGALEQSLVMQPSDEMQNMVNSLTDKKLAIYHADQTNKIDFAAHYSGGDVVYASQNELVRESDHLFSSLFDSYLPTKPPQVMLRGDTTPGNCWPMAGSNGWAVVRLRDTISISSVSIEHVPASITPRNGTAPKGLRVWGLDGVTQPTGATPEGFPRTELLCEFEYSLESNPLQEHACVSAAGKTHRFVGLEVLSNHGASFTCMYRFRVHGSTVNTL
jgi:SUN domain-containing protein 1/2